MNEKKIDILIDTIPFIPDIYTNEKKYLKKNNINQLNSSQTSQTIFIFNLSEDLIDKTFYNDPNYMLYGVQRDGVEYLLPPILYYYQNPNSASGNYTYPNGEDVDINYGCSELPQTLELYTILKLIGYNISDIVTVDPDPCAGTTTDTDKSFCKFISCFDFDLSVTSKVYFFYFIVKNQTMINYNKYKDIIYYNDSYWNVCIYPFVNEFAVLPSPYEFGIYYDTTVNKIKSDKNTFNNLNFDNVELTSFNQKLNYKYFEKPTSVNNLQVLNYYSKNIRSFADFIKSISTREKIYISLNELGSLFFKEVEYNTDNIPTTNNINIANVTYLNTDFNKVNNSYINIPQANSFTMNGKFSYINNKLFNNDKNYSQFSFNPDGSINVSLTDKLPLVKNFTINSYVDINYVYKNDTNMKENIFSVVNNYIRKILILINPQIIDTDYLNSDDVSVVITNLLENNNILIFSPTNKIKLVLPSDNIKFTNSYYIDRYKLTFIYPSDNEKTNYFYYNIYINIAFYNSLFVYIINKFQTSDFAELSNINITFVEQYFRLLPNIFDEYNITKIYKDLNELDTLFINYYYQIDYTNFTKQINYNKYDSVMMFHVYFTIPNITPQVYYIPTDSEDKYLISNLFNVAFQEINKFIQEIIFLSLYYNKYAYNRYAVGTYFNISTSIDNNISDEYLTYYNYQDIDNDIDLAYINYFSNFNINDQSNFLPYGYYKFFKFKKLFPNNDFIDQTPENDVLAIQTKILDVMTSNNYGLLIKTYPFCNYDDKLFSIIYDTEYYDFYLNYQNFNKINTNFYLAVCSTEGNIYIKTDNKIVTYNLFNYENISDPIIFQYQQKFDLLINEYFNFYNMNFLSYIFFPNQINNSLILNKFKLNPHINSNVPDIIYFDSLRFNSSDPYEKIELTVITSIDDINNLISSYFECLNISVSLEYFFTIYLLIKKVYYFTLILQITSLSKNSKFSNIGKNIVTGTYVDNELDTLLNLIVLNFLKIINIIYVQNQYIYQIIDSSYIDSIYTTITNAPIVYEVLIPLINNFIFYIENIIFTTIEKLSSKIKENILFIDNLDTTFPLPNYDDLKLFIDKYINTYSIYRTLEANILANKLIDSNSNILVYKTAIYLYNINNIYNIIDFNVLMDNYLDQKEALKLIKYNYIFDFNYLISLNNSFFSVIYKLQFLYQNIQTAIISPDPTPTQEIYIKLETFGISNLIAELLTNLQELTNILALSLVAYEQNLPFEIPQELLDNIVATNNLIFNIIVQENVCMYYYFINDINYFINYYIQTINELKTSEYYKYEILNLNPNFNFQNLDIIDYNTILFNMYGSLKEIINLIVSVFITDTATQQEIKELIFTVNNAYLISQKFNKDSLLFYKKNLYNLYNDHLEINSNIFNPNQLIGNYFYYFNTTNIKLYNKYFMYIINDEIYNIIDTYYTLKTDFVDFFKDTFNLNIRNYLSYAYINMQLDYVE